MVSRSRSGPSSSARSRSPSAPRSSLAGAGFLVGLKLLPDPRAERSQVPAPPIWDLPLRALCALLLVLALTATAGWLGSRLSGLLAPFPVVASVLAVFTHAQRGADEFLRLARGLIAGFFAFALFCFTLSVSLRTLGIAAAFVLATGVAVLVQGLLLMLATRTGAGMGSACPALTLFADCHP